jgi:RNA polymerase sigma-70 factor, ECF subfamily
MSCCLSLVSPRGEALREIGKALVPGARLRYALGVPDETKLLDRLRAGDEAAFASLVDEMHGALRRLVEVFVGRGASADEVIQDTWVAVLDGLSRFEGRSSVKTWIGSIAVNLAKTRRARDWRDQFLFTPDGDCIPEEGRMGTVGFWSEAPPPMPQPDDALDAKRARAILLQEIERLPEGQRAVVTLRDVSEWSAEEVCNVLGLSETNQRVLLHRARMRLRAALARQLGKEQSW